MHDDQQQQSPYQPMSQKFNMVIAVVVAVPAVLWTNGVSP
jgi:hypothetical protein